MRGMPIDTWRHMADDLMMVELIASLPIIQSATAPIMRPPPPVLAAPAQGEAPRTPSSPMCGCRVLCLDSWGHVGGDVVEDLMVVELVASPLPSRQLEPRQWNFHLMFCCSCRARSP